MQWVEFRLRLHKMYLDNYDLPNQRKRMTASVKMLEDIQQK